jgi:hypothetical protein
MEKITSADGTTLAVDRAGAGPTLVLDGGDSPDWMRAAAAAGSRRHVPHGARRGPWHPAPARGARGRDQSRVT